MTAPGPCGGTGNGTGQMCLSAPVAAAAAETAEPIAAAAADFVASSAALAAGAPGVPWAAADAASADLIAASEAFLAACNPDATAAGRPRHAGSPPMRTVGLPGPGDKGAPCAVGSDKRAAGPVGKISNLVEKLDHEQSVGDIRLSGLDLLYEGAAKPRS